MAIVRLTCPECDKVFKASALPPPGKKVKCPACKHAFAPPQDDDDVNEADDDEDEPPGKKTPAKKGNVATGKKSRHEEEDDEEEPDEDDSDEEDAPVKKKKKKKKAGGSNVLYWVYRGGSVLVLLLLLGVLAFVLLNRRPKLNDESTVELAPGETRSTTIDAIPDNQKVNVSATALSGQFSIYVFLKKDKAEAEKAIDAFKESPKFLALKTKTTDASLQVTVPGKENAVVLLTSGDNKKAEVKLKLTN